MQIDDFSTDLIVPEIYSCFGDLVSKLLENTKQCFVLSALPCLMSVEM